MRLTNKNEWNNDDDNKRASTKIHTMAVEIVALNLLERNQLSDRHNSKQAIYYQTTSSKATITGSSASVVLE